MSNKWEQFIQIKTIGKKNELLKQFQVFFLFDAKINNHFTKIIESRFIEGLRFEDFINMGFLQLFAKFFFFLFLMQQENITNCPHFYSLI